MGEKGNGSLPEGAVIKAVIFDIDGTLVDSFGAYYKVFNMGIGRFGLGPVSREFLGDCLAKAYGLSDILREILPPGDDGAVEECKGEIKRLFLLHGEEEVKPFPGVDALFRHLEEEDIKIGVATGRMSSEEDEWKRFARLGLDGAIHAIVTSRDVVNRKPAPDVIVECAKRLGVSPAHCMAVGDTEADIVAARGAGAYAVAVKTGQDDPEHLSQALPDLLFESVTDLIEFLMALDEPGQGL